MKLGTNEQAFLWGMWGSLAAGLIVWWLQNQVVKTQVSSGISAQSINRREK